MKIVKVNPDYVKRIISEERKLLLEHDRYAKMIIREGHRLKDEGYTAEQIDEGLMDIISSLGGGFIDTFKAQFANWIIKKLGFATDGYLAKLLVQIFERMEIMQIRKYFSAGGCEPLTKVIMDAIAEAGVEAPADGFMKGLGIPPESRIYQTAREAITNSIMKGEMAEMIKETISEWICSIDVSSIVDIFKDGLGAASTAGGGLMSKIKGMFGGGGAATPAAAAAAGAAAGAVT